ncbi:DNA-binding protein S1FA-like isoform X1 [Vigna unguiculata]|uniref:DNA-binding protein S1FA-like isoform X1 n=1 Tax=Vigna unguiculata TaxID=3917 RepID=UPI00101633F2|nr:DNA-binding protein S1FA-like isoform X1 [Vigna unguiculata]
MTSSSQIKFLLRSIECCSFINKRLILQEDYNSHASNQGFNPGLIVLLVVGGLLLTFLVGNFVLYTYAQKTLPPRKKKPVSKKKMKKERLKQGVSAPGE